MIRSLALCLALMISVTVTADQPAIVTATIETAPLFNYEDAPATPDADDPAIWVNRHNPAGSLVIGTAKDAGVLVYDLSGHLVQTLSPPNAPRVTAADPPTPAGLNLSDDEPCTESESGETFGRYNNVDIAYGVRLGAQPDAPLADVAVVSDRGCDRVRFFRIDPNSQTAPLVNITSPSVTRVFPQRYDQPSPVQPSGGIEGWADNPLDDQNTVYGLTVANASTLFVTERERGVVRQLRVVAQDNGRLSYEVVRTFVFDTTFDLTDADGLSYAWTPCREAVQEEPQSEGVVFDAVNSTLYVAFETIGLYHLPVQPSLPALVRVGRDRLIEPIESFGQPYRATPDDDEFECEYNPEGPPGDGEIDAEGSNANAGRFLQADLEGLSILDSVPHKIVLLASSQGDSSFHFYTIHGDQPRHMGSFLIDGVGETDGVHYVPGPITPRYPRGLLVVQNGEAPEPPDTGDVNGYELDGSTQFKFVNFVETLRAVH